MNIDKRLFAVNTNKRNEVIFKVYRIVKYSLCLICPTNSGIDMLMQKLGSHIFFLCLCQSVNQPYGHFGLNNEL